jgi:hypothetical protein
MRKLVLAAVGLLLMTLPSQALLIKDLGNNPNSATGHFSNSVLGTTFEDQYLFHLVGGPSFITFASATNDFTSVTDFITNFTGQLFYAGANGVIGGGDDVAFGPIVNAGPCFGNPAGCQILAGSAVLGVGNYYLDIKGTGGGTAGYGGDLTVSPAAVPGPIVGAGIPGIIAAAFGLIGLARRRKNATA